MTLAWTKQCDTPTGLTAMRTDSDNWATTLPGVNSLTGNSQTSPGPVSDSSAGSRSTPSSAEQSKAQRDSADTGNTVPEPDPLPFSRLASSSSVPYPSPSSKYSAGMRAGVSATSGVIILSLVKLSLWAEVLLLRGVGSEDTSAVFPFNNYDDGKNDDNSDDYEDDGNAENDEDGDND
ncbi:hypothetical protein PoB_007235300 [Plakobranchus ocellatus]|uniref:Uncharacterized protein n=1 Tax=Plakobranchus ocellatus TaxID=259542 RepID=A0AAV4DP66_9GAST|nr:hypothetical protein PoB_007235300 [Plakobranchus ocellatus]